MRGIQVIGCLFLVACAPLVTDTEKKYPITDAYCNTMARAAYPRNIQRTVVKEEEVGGEDISCKLGETITCEVVTKSKVPATYSRQDLNLTNRRQYVTACLGMK
jgi:hypothetical protein